ncbi:metal ABC transporter ATP-binding protein [Phycisphaerales bacterium AB-hyl4]|uniref:Metal ABC transporter ATP-binding protein n=1 Tax=Natronomicrosphaera hydrolytica TaxID=3242702 RepID=A0ABV4U2K7_9BACT
MHQHADCHHDDSLARHDPAHDAICLDHVSYHYPPRLFDRDQQAAQLALDDVTLHIERGVNLGIIGPNGAGKSTLLRIMLGLLEGYTGSVHIAGLTPRDACRQGNIVGYVPQRADVEWRFPLTATQVVRMGLVGKTGLFRWYSKSDKQYVEHIMEQVGVTDLRNRTIGALSGGQQQRLFIARALVAKPSILILDEPLVGIDETGQRQFAELIHALHESLELTMVIVSHDIQAIAAGCNRVACLKRRIHYHDAPEGLTPEVLAEVFEHEIAPVIRRTDLNAKSPRHQDAKQRTPEN